LSPRAFEPKARGLDAREALGNGKRSCGLWDNGGDAAKTPPSRSVDSREEEAAEGEATRQLGRLSSILPISGAHSRITPLTPDTTHTGTTRMREWESRSVLSAWSDYVGTPVRSINPGPTVKPCDGSVVQWFNFLAPRNSPPPSAPNLSKFNMSEAQHS
jgi:hypothetical protein